MCMVFKVPDNPYDNLNEDHSLLVDTPPKIFSRLNLGGLETRLYKSVQGDEVYCLIGATEDRLETEAERIMYSLKLNRNRAIEIGARQGITLAQVTKNRDESSNFITTSLWEGLYGRFNKETKAVYETYRNDGKMHLNSVFRSVDRLKLIYSIIEAPLELGGCSLAIGNIESLPSTRFKGLFALHDSDQLNSLGQRWNATESYWNQPINEIRDYFGEEIGMYFAFLQFYNYWLVALGAVGLIFFALQAADGIADAGGLWAYAIFCSLWATLFLEAWKNKEARLSLRWGMTKFSETEQPRPEFVGSRIRSPITGQLIQYFPFWKKVIRAFFAQSVVWFLIVVVTGGVVGIFILRRVLINGSDLGKYYAAIINAVMIMVFNILYGMMAGRLNDFENHETDTQFFNALISKNFLFKFVNSYNSLFYFAFFRQFETNEELKCDTETQCLEDLAIQLGFVFGSMIVINNTLEILIPMVNNYLSERANATASEDEKEKRQALKDAMTAPENQFNLEVYENTVNDYEELAIQFGFVVLFVVVLPITPILALANNMFEIRVDSFKLMKLTKRPEPRGASNIGTWKAIFTVISFISVITNIGIAVFYSTEIDRYVNGDIVQKFTIAVITEHVIFLLKFGMDFFIPDEPVDVTEHRLRQDHIENTLINGSLEEKQILNEAEEEEFKDLEPFFDMEKVDARMESDWHIQF